MSLPVVETWYATKDYADGVTRFYEPHVHDWLRPNIWHVRGRDRDLLVDSGTGIVPIRSELVAHLERDILAVASHTHFDHIGGHYEFAARACHAAEAFVLENPDNDNTVANLFYDSAMLIGIGFEPAMVEKMDPWLQAVPREGYDVRTDYGVRAAPATELLDEGDVVDLGDRAFQVLYLPGHSPGSIGLFEEATGVFLSGDAIYDPATGPLLDFYDFSDIDAYVATMERIRALPVSAVHGGHYESCGRERMIEIADDYIASKKAPGCPSEQLKPS